MHKQIKLYAEEQCPFKFEFYIERSDIDAVFVIVKDTAHYHSSEFPKSCRKTVIKMVQTPTDKVLPSNTTFLKFYRTCQLNVPSPPFEFK